MKESMSSRVGRIISGSLNAVVDAVENSAPEIVMKEAIREIESAIDDIRTEYGRVVAQKHLSTKSLASENEKYDALEEQAALAVKEGRDDLAKAAIKKTMQIEAQIPILEKTITECSDKERELDSYVRALQGKKDDMFEEMNNYIESTREAKSIAASGSKQNLSSDSDIPSKVNKASLTFNRILGQAGLDKAVSSLTNVDEARIAELEELSRNNRIEERLAKLKARGDGSK